MSSSYIFTSESVTEGHPDKISDQISDAILDYLIARDPHSRVACETLISNGYCVIAGELKTNAYAPMQEIARETLRQIGYTDASFGFDYRSAGVLNGVGEQSPDINQGVDKDSGELGAGDQGMMFGYACKETQTLMPLPITLAHALTKGLATNRKNGNLPFLRPDGKAQVSVRYVDGKPQKIETIVVSTQHDPDVNQQRIKDAVIEEIIYKNIDKSLLADDVQYLINPTGRFVIGGPQGDAGLTGRKIIVDTYGGSCPHGGGAFSGKDPTKVDRSGAYAARYVAKNLVASGACERVTVQISYAIGVVEPVSIYINTHATSKFSHEQLEKAVRTIFDLTPKGIIETLDLLQPIYKATAAYGHFGREEDGFNWEKTDKAEAIKEFLKIK
jgi:S-adenosylmethionine synthetase